MPTPTHNLFGNIPSTVQEEFIQVLAKSGQVRIERIVSDGHTTPQGEWYDQEWDEWVLLVSGGATLLFEGNAAPTTLKPGDHVLIPAHRRHRVEWSDKKTVWVAVHFDGNK